MKKFLLTLITFYSLNGIYIQAQSSADEKKISVNKIIVHPYPDFPYHPIPYLLDLCILSYQLYAQTLVWPFDPYYETTRARKHLLEIVHTWAKAKGIEQNKDSPSISDFRGPGELSMFPNNELHDPIIFRYSSVYPWNNCIVNADNRWTIYETPKKVTNQIKDVYICYRKNCGNKEDLNIERVIYKNIPRDIITGENILICFEGGTGDKGNRNQPASQSLMGFVLLRRITDNNFDIDIVFRGSRSGSGARAFLQAFPGKNPKGNPDWITDFGYDLRNSAKGAADITTVGSVNRGMMYSMDYMLPAIFKSLYFVDSICHHKAPQHIYITGHSLGGALAQHFVSAILMGSRYSINNTSDSSLNTLKSWPWKQIKLVTFCSPVAGNKIWAKTLTEQKLGTDFFGSWVRTYDPKALRVFDTLITSNLLSITKPAAFRVLIPTDPISSKKIGLHGKPVGKTVYVKKHTWIDMFRFFDLSAHEPINVRRYIINGLLPEQIPSQAWEYQNIEKMGENTIKEKKGSIGYINNLVSIIKDYYEKNGRTFDNQQLDRDVVLWKQIMGYQ